MNDLPRSLRDELEARILARIHGELTAEDQAAIDRILAADADLCAYRDHIAELDAELGGLLSVDESAPRKLPAQARAAFVETPRKPRKRAWHLTSLVTTVTAAIALLGLLALVLLGQLGSHRTYQTEELAFEASTTPTTSPPRDDDEWEALPQAMPPARQSAFAEAEEPAPSVLEMDAQADPFALNMPRLEMADSAREEAMAGELRSQAPVRSRRSIAPDEGAAMAPPPPTPRRMAAPAEPEIAKATLALPKPVVGVRETNDLTEDPTDFFVEQLTAEDPFSTFSLNVSEVSFRLAMESLERGQLPAPEAIRSEEFVNAFDYRDALPGPREPVALRWETARVPFLHNRWLVRFSVAAGASGRPAQMPLNLTLLVDNSGSMERADRRAILANALQQLAPMLQPKDQLSVITFARQPRILSDATSGSQAEEVFKRTLAQQPEGGTNLEEALELAYEVTKRNQLPNSQSRIVLMTDGAANLGDIQPERLRERTIQGRREGIALDAFGIGWDGYHDAMLEALTRNSDGRYAFLNDPDRDAAHFARRLAGALEVAAKNVKVQVEWNPARVIQFRQIGYQRHRLATEDFRNNTVDAAEIARREAGTALYVIQVNEGDPGELGTLRVRFQDPSTGHYHEQAWPLYPPARVFPLQEASPSLRLAASAAFFAEALAGAPSAETYSLADLAPLTTGLAEAFPHQEAVSRLLSNLQNARRLRR